MAFEIKLRNTVFIIFLSANISIELDISFIIVIFLALAEPVDSLRTLLTNSVSVKSSGRSIIYQFINFLLIQFINLVLNLHFKSTFLDVGFFNFRAQFLIFNPYSVLEYHNEGCKYDSI